MVVFAVVEEGMLDVNVPGNFPDCSTAEYDEDGSQSVRRLTFAEYQSDVYRRELGDGRVALQVGHPTLPGGNGQGCSEEEAKLWEKEFGKLYTFEEIQKIMENTIHE